MDLLKNEFNSCTNSSVNDCRVVANVGPPPPLPRTDLSETNTTSEDSYRFAGNVAASCRTALLSENGLFRVGLKHMLQKSRISVIGEGHDIASLLDAMKMRPIPELVICHIASDRNDRAVLDFIRSLRLHFTQAKLVVLADTCTSSIFPSSVSTYVNAVLLTTISSGMLMQSLEFVLLGYRVYPAEVLPSIAGAPVQQSVGWVATESLTILSQTTATDDTYLTQERMPTTLSSPPQVAARISQREDQVLRCLVSGLSNKSIARELNIVEGTVKVYLKLLSRKLKLANRTQLAIWALQQSRQFDTASVGGSVNAQSGQVELDGRVVLPDSINE